MVYYNTKSVKPHPALLERTCWGSFKSVDAPICGFVASGCRCNDDGPERNRPQNPVYENLERRDFSNSMDFIGMMPQHPQAISTDRNPFLLC